ncbi:hypothetical protein [Holdemanella biformis]|uniref:hypothetical protein n=1 Tax=Holdemanella biformis TaxID=1735 RepID=UPI0011C23C3E|nr:hypothetical protein [Holdemanella biformis]
MNDSNDNNPDKINKIPIMYKNIFFCSSPKIMPKQATTKVKLAAFFNSAKLSHEFILEKIFSNKLSILEASSTSVGRH